MKRSVVLQIVLIELIATCLAAGCPAVTRGTASVSLTPTWAVHHANAAGTLAVSLVDLVVDTSGNVYVAGSSSTSMDGQDYVVSKLDPGGKTLWVREYDGPGHSDDVPAAIKMDPAGNIVVTGTSLGTAGANDICTIKYDPDGNVIWTQRLSTGGTDGYQANTLIVDAAGSSYILGETQSQYQHAYLLLLKYDVNGTLLLKQLLGDNNGDAAGDITLDSSGNIYLTGSINWGNARITAKYAADGTFLWQRTLPGYVFQYISTLGIAASPGGDVYVAGTLDQYSQPCGLYLVKFSNSGTLLWQDSVTWNQYDTFRAMSIDRAGNVFVTGNGVHDGGYWDGIITVKCGPSGNVQWLRSYVIPNGRVTTPKALRVDASGNVYIIGRCEENYGSAKAMTLKYDSSGTFQWVDQFAGSQEALNIALGPSGNVYSVCYGGVISSCSGSGHELWSSVTTAPAYSTVSAIGAVYASGKFVGAVNSPASIITMAFGADGATQWIGQHSDSGTSCAASAINYDSQGNVIVVGQSGSTPVILKIGPGGAELRSTYYGGPGGAGSGLGTVAWDSSGNLYCAGQTSYDRGRFLTLKFGKDGTKLLDLHDVIPWIDQPVARAIAVDRSGNIVITGSVSRAAVPGDPNTQQYWATVKYAPDGTPRYIQYYAPGQASRVIVDGAGSAYVAGTTPNGIVVVKYDSAGNQVWATPLNTGSWSAVVGMAFDPEGHFIVAGQGRLGSQSAYVVIRVTPAGLVDWSSWYAAVSTYTAGANPYTMTIDGKGNTYVVGETQDSSGLNSCLTVKFTLQGAIEWDALYRYDGTSGRSNSTGRGIALDSDGNVYILANSSNGTGMAEITTALQYKQPLTAIHQQGRTIPAETSLLQ
ncbi:MAG TPA: hypothetical protein VMH23_11380, partial [Bacteroidota bacterium]|nr:hypothetical protein [Bacteroidota bacterium]